MQTQIEFVQMAEGAILQERGAAVDGTQVVIDNVRDMVRRAMLWLDQKSTFYSRICEFSVTRRTALRVNLITLFIIIGAFAVVTQPLASIVSGAMAAWLTYRLNQSEKGGEA